MHKETLAALMCLAALVFSFIGGSGREPDPPPMAPVAVVAAWSPAPPSELEALPHAHAPARCEMLAFEGAHSAVHLNEARAGAGEELVDACPSNHVMYAQVDCPPAPGLHTDDGQPLFRCVARGQCRLCGADLARFKEANPGTAP